MQVGYNNTINRGRKEVAVGSLIHHVRHQNMGKNIGFHSK